jgi:hypothetical protein
MFSAAAKDKEFSRHVHAFGARMIGVGRFLSPLALMRALWINLRHGRPFPAELRGVPMSQPLRPGPLGRPFFALAPDGAMV